MRPTGHKEFDAENLKKFRDLFKQEGGESELIRRQELSIEAQKARDDAQKAYEACMERVHAEPDGTSEEDKVPAQYAPPENPNPKDVDHEVM